MKSLIITVLAVLLPFFCSSQIIEVENDTIYEYVMLDTTSVDIDYRLTELILDNFVTDACKYGLDSLEVVNHIKHLDAIYLGNLPEDKLGVTMFVEDTLSPIGIRGIIFIDQTLTINYPVYKMTLYHELGHWFGLAHSRRGLMVSNSENVFKLLSRWDKEVKRLMRKIKSNGYSYPEIPNEE